MKKLGIVFVSAIIMLNICGCAPLIIGAAVGAAGGYCISKDTIQGETDKSFASLWDAALMVGKIRGNVKQEDLRQGYVYLESDSGKVWIRIIRLTRSTVRLRVAARKFHFPDLELAQDIFNKIMEEAK